MEIDDLFDEVQELDMNVLLRSSKIGHLKALEDAEFFKCKYEDALGDIASLKHALNQTSDIKFQQDAIKSEFSDIESMLIRKEELLKSANLRQIQMQKKVEAQEELIKKLQGKVEKLQSTRSEINNNWQKQFIIRALSRIKGQERLKGKFNELQDKYQTLKEKFKQMENYYQVQKQKNDKLQSKLFSRKQKILKMADNMNRFKTQYDISKSGQTALEKINNDLSIRNHYLITENQELKNQITNQQPQKLPAEINDKFKLIYNQLLEYKADNKQKQSIIQELQENQSKTYKILQEKYDRLLLKYQIQSEKNKENLEFIKPEIPKITLSTQRSTTPSQQTQRKSPPKRAKSRNGMLTERVWRY